MKKIIGILGAVILIVAGAILPITLIVPLVLVGCSSLPSEQDFKVEISVSAENFYKGSNIVVYMKFTNLTNRSFNITRSTLMLTYIKGLGFYTSAPDVAVSDVIASREIRNDASSLGNSLALGTHELRAVAIFNASGQRFEIWSNVINLTVEEVV